MRRSCQQATAMSRHNQRTRSATSLNSSTSRSAARINPLKVPRATSLWAGTDSLGQDLNLGGFDRKRQSHLRPDIQTGSDGVADHLHRLITSLPACDTSWNGGTFGNPCPIFIAVDCYCKVHVYILPEYGLVGNLSERIIAVVPSVKRALTRLRKEAEPYSHRALAWRSD